MHKKKGRTPTARPAKAKGRNPNDRSFVRSAGNGIEGLTLQNASFILSLPPSRVRTTYTHSKQTRTIRQSTPACTRQNESPPEREARAVSPGATPATAAYESNNIPATDQSKRLPDGVTPHLHTMVKQHTKTPGNASSAAAAHPPPPRNMPQKTTRLCMQIFLKNPRGTARITKTHPGPFNPPTKAMKTLISPL